MNFGQCPDCTKNQVIVAMEEDVLYVLTPPFMGEPVTSKIPVMVPVHTCQACGFKFTGEEAARIRDDRMNEFLYSMGHGRPKEWSPKWKGQGPKETP